MKKQEQKLNQLMIPAQTENKATCMSFF